MVDKLIAIIQNYIQFWILFAAEKMGPVAVTDFERHVHELHSNRDHEFSLEFSVTNANTPPSITSVTGIISL